MDKVSIVILNWNGLADTLECLQSVHNIDYSDYRVVVVDNGSTDGSPDVIKRNFPEAKVIENRRNLGFAGGNNVGIRYALSRGSDYLFLLNNDTVVDPLIVRTLVTEAKKHEEAVIFGAKVNFYSQPERIWFAGGKWSLRRGHCVVLGWGEMDSDRSHHSVEEVDYVSGCAMFFGESVTKKIGLLAPEFFLTFEDTDWCYRARKAGVKCLMVPTAQVWHKVSASFGGKSPLYNYFFTRNRLLWAQRHLSSLERSFVYLNMIREFISLAAKSRKIAYSLDARARLLGVRDYFMGRTGGAPNEVKELNRRYISR